MRWSGILQSGTPIPTVFENIGGRITICNADGHRVACKLTAVEGLKGVQAPHT